MKASISLEHIGASLSHRLSLLENIEKRLGISNDAGNRPFSGPFVARIFRDSNGDICRAFINGNRDYSKSNSKGTRGIYINFILNINEIYFIREPKSWRHTDEYFASVNLDGSVFKLSKEQAEEWLSCL